MGQSIQRETFMLKKVVSELMPPISLGWAISAACGVKHDDLTSRDDVPATGFLSGRNSVAGSLTLI